MLTSGNNLKKNLKQSTCVLGPELFCTQYMEGSESECNFAVND